MGLRDVQSYTLGEGVSVGCGNGKDFPIKHRGDFHVAGSDQSFRIDETVTRAE